MNSVERVNAVLDLKKPDRAPVGLHNYLRAASFYGVDDLGTWLHDGGSLADAQIAFWKEVKHDFIQLENSTCAMADAIGCEIAYDKKLPPHVKKPRFTDYSQLEGVEPPDPFTTQPLKALVQAGKILLKEIGKDVYIQTRADQGPIALAISIFPYEQFLMDCVDPDKEQGINILLDFCTRCILRLVEAYAKIGAPATCIGGMGTSLISPPLWLQFEKPYQEKYVQGCKRLGVRSFTHTCGREDKIIPEIVATGCSALELDPKSTPTLVRDALKGKSTVLGMIDPVKTLGDGTPADVTAQAREMFDIFHPDVPFIVAAGCAIPPYTPIENCQTLVEAAEKYGRF